MNDAEKELARLDEEALLYLMNDRRGRWFMMRIFDYTFMNATTFSRDAAMAAFNEGKRSVGLKYHRELTQDAQHIALKQLAEQEYGETMSRLDAMKGDSHERNIF